MAVLTATCPRYAAEPLLGREMRSGVLLDRPLTKFLVMADAETKYKEAADRHYQRKLLLDSLTVNVPKDLQADYYNNTRLDRIVEIVTWARGDPSSSRISGITSWPRRCAESPTDLTRTSGPVCSTVCACSEHGVVNRTSRTSSGRAAG